MPQQKGCLTVIEQPLFEHKLPYEARSSDYKFSLDGLAAI
jgi:hypothetical protein